MLSILKWFVVFWAVNAAGIVKRQQSDGIEASGDNADLKGKAKS